MGYGRLQRIRKYLHAHRRYRRNSRAKFTEADLTQARRGFKREMRKEKRRYWRNYVSEISTDPGMANLHRIFNSPVQQELAGMEDEQGVVGSPQEGINILAQTHFPRSRTEPPVGP